MVEAEGIEPSSAGDPRKGASGLVGALILDQGLPQTQFPGPSPQCF
jgi:hypothetical protein